MNYRSLWLAAVATMITFCTLAQNRRSLLEDKPITVDGVELGYIITEEDSRTAAKEEFARFKITLYANNGGCSRPIRLRENIGSAGSSTNRVNAVATFYIRNANGRRLTAREGTLSAPEWWLPVQVRERNSEGKEVTVLREMMAGYIFREGAHLETSITVLVPFGDRPQVDVILHRASDM